MFATGLMPTSSSSSSALSWMLFGALPSLMSQGMSTFSLAVNSGSRWWNWKMKPMVSFRSSASWFLFIESVRFPSM